MNNIPFDPSTYIIQSPPGDTLLEAIQARGMTQAELALRTGRPLKTINEIIKGKAAITPETALQFERVLGISAAFWIHREQQYRESQSRQVERLALQEHVGWIALFPLNKLVEYGWLELEEDPVDQVKSILNFFGVASPDLWQAYWSAAIPGLNGSTSFQKDPGSTTAWLRKGELEANSRACKPFDGPGLRSLLPYILDLIGKPAQDFYPDLVQMCSQAGVAICVVPDLPNVNISRLTRWLSPTKALTQLRAVQSPEAFWDSVFHALVHILVHGKRDIYLDEDGAAPGRYEIEAQRFAAETLNSYSWNDQEPLSWEFLKEPDAGIDEWENIPDTPETDEIYPVEESELIDYLALQGWPGLSAAARRALKAAGLDEEASRIDEQLFSRWVKDQLAAFQSAYSQGYQRDALSDLENLVSMLQVGVRISPALECFVEALQILKQMVEEESQFQEDPREQLRLVIQEAFQPLKDEMISASRKDYSSIATRTEKNLADQLFKQD